ncbi:11712_t:CDS:2 [Funneliformis geosporum]|nr:11712_t:CDS:2 [Funneliformis geosporum]
MPAKLTFICIIDSTNERDTLDYIVREVIGIIRREEDTNIDIKITAFYPKDSSVPRWVPLFVPENVLRFTGKFTLNELPPHNPLELDQNHLPISSISVFITGFAIESVQNEDIMFKSIKILVNEFTKGTSSRKKFQIKYRYLKSDERINKKLIKTRRSSNLLITGELVQVDSEFQVDIQDVNFLPMFIANLESSTKTSPFSKYSYQKSSKTPSKDQTDKESVITDNQ